jgi:hypothetical protein
MSINLNELFYKQWPLILIFTNLSLIHNGVVNAYDFKTSPHPVSLFIQSLACVLMSNLYHLLFFYVVAHPYTKYYTLFSYQTGYIMWHSRLRIERNINHKPEMSHYIPCLIGNGHLEIRKMKIKEANLFNTVGCCI